MDTIKNAKDVAQHAKGATIEELALMEEGTQCAHDISKLLRDRGFTFEDETLILIQVILDTWSRARIKRTSASCLMLAKHVIECPVNYHFD